MAITPENKSCFMGFRSALVSQEYHGELPNWFKEKYNGEFFFPVGLMVSSKAETKIYDNNFFEDYQRAINESGFWSEKNISIVIVVLAEDGFITKVVINKEEIKYIWMDEGVESDHVWCQG